MAGHKRRGNAAAGELSSNQRVDVPAFAADYGPAASPDISLDSRKSFFAVCNNHFAAKLCQQIARRYRRSCPVIEIAINVFAPLGVWLCDESAPPTSPGVNLDPRVPSAIEVVTHRRLPGRWLWTYPHRPPPNQSTGMGLHQVLDQRLYATANGFA
jgi:hypothetical protein